MDFSKLSASDKQAAIAALVAGLLAIYALAAGWGAVMFLPLLGAAAALAIILMPQMSPTTSLPGSKGSLLLIAAGVTAVLYVIDALVYIGYIIRNLVSVDALLFLIGLAASLWLLWVAWQEFQAEGGAFQIGSSGSASSSSATMSGPMVPPPSSSGRSESMGAPGMTEPTPPPPASTTPDEETR